MAKQPAKSNARLKREQAAKAQARAKQTQAKAPANAIPSQEEQEKQLVNYKRWEKQAQKTKPATRGTTRPAQSFGSSVESEANASASEPQSNDEEFIPDYGDEGQSDDAQPDDGQPRGGVFQSDEDAVANAQDFFQAQSGNTAGKIYAAPQQRQEPTIDAPDESGGNSGGSSGSDGGDGQDDSSHWEQLLQIATEIRDSLVRVEALLSPDGGGG